ncbi:chromatin assembly factor 1 subunit A-domain-containing protein [Xylaria bambusicola]|uniref:chromatin assembly factor 1 subunit A-domain-containing protein n=1 Tax=Xylaria bambusicola TaxID=326684 RepID=UPI0020074A31|nr:chromatin assembly factor 1 subunit A-domain-containing protein [Xylaria bambusicola]KAI0514367.1 chromatin assembly factor 1 subunit A-domain-containing protein [Xylaria bambusicola]
MPLSPLSPNVKVSQAVAKDGAHDDCAHPIDTATACHTSIDAPGCENLSVPKPPTMSSTTVDGPPPQSSERSSTPEIKMGSTPDSSPALTEFSCTPPRDSPPPHVTPSTLSLLSTALPTKPVQGESASKPISAPKRKHTATTEDKAKERAEKKQKQEAAVAEKEAMKAKKALEKATKAAKKARVDTEKEANKAAKAAEKAKAEAAKEAKKQKKQEEELAAKAKQEKQQNLMASFLKKAPTTPSKPSTPSLITSKTDTASPSAPKQDARPTKPTKSAYELNFKPFFIKSGVTMAPPLCQMDDETRKAKEAILDDYMRGDRGEYNPKRPFDAADTFSLAFPQQRGVIPPSVKKIMERIHGDPYQNTFGLTNTRSESQTEKLISSAKNELAAVPMKYLRFYEDVRPAYFGTMTTPMTYRKLRTLSRRPAGKILPLAYEYDSEAEWVEDDGEDLDDAEDEEEDLDGDEEMDDFVDDSEAIPTIIRPGFESDSVPVSTGISFENQKRLGPSSTVYKYKLEFLLDSLEHHSMIDPFSTEYWPIPAKKVPVTVTLSSTQGTITSMLPPSAPRDGAKAACKTTTLDGKDVVPKDLLVDFKRALLSDEYKDFSKGTVIEVLAKKFSTCTKSQVKATLDMIAHRVTPAGQAKRSKIWVLLPGFGLEENN